MREPTKADPVAREDQQDGPDIGGGLVGVAIRQPVFTTMIMVGLVVLGVFSFRRPVDRPVPRRLDPRRDGADELSAAPRRRPWSAKSPSRIEEAVNPSEGVDKLTSTLLEGVSAVTVEFELGTDMDAAAADVRSKIEQIRRKLPAEIDQPIVQQFDPAAQPIVSLALASSTRAPPR